MVERHPWNNDFTWSPPPGSAELAQHLFQQFNEQGFCVLDGLFDADEVAAVVRETDKYEARVRQHLEALQRTRLPTAKDSAITFAQRLVTRSSYLRTLVVDRRLLAIVGALLGPDANLHWDQAVYKQPDKPATFPWHQDNGYSYVVPQQYLNVWIALSDTGVEQGCLWMAPGLHKLGTLRHYPSPAFGKQCFESYVDAVPVPVGIGSAIVFSSLLPHMSGENTASGSVRRSYLVTYASAGAELLLGDPHAGPPTGAAPLENRAWRFPVLRAGQPVDASTLDQIGPDNAGPKQESHG